MAVSFNLLLNEKKEVRKAKRVSFCMINVNIRSLIKCFFPEFREELVAAESMQFSVRFQTKLEVENKEKFQI